MARVKKIDRGVPVRIYLPASIRDKMNAQLHSELEGRVPFGAVSHLIELLVVEWLKGQGVAV